MRWCAKHAGAGEMSQKEFTLFNGRAERPSGAVITVNLLVTDIGMNVK